MLNCVLSLMKYVFIIVMSVMIYILIVLGLRVLFVRARKCLVKVRMYLDTPE